MTELDLWNRALPLAQALREFAPKDLLATLEANPLRDMVDYLRPMIGVRNDALSEIMATVTERMKRESESHWTAKRNLAHAVFACYSSGSHVLIGFDGPRSINSTPVRVPPQLLNFLPDWENGTYKHEGLNLTQLRMIEAPAEMHPLPSPRPAMLGRPGIGLQVQAAFAAMVAEGTINPAASALAHYPLLRLKLLEGGDGEAMSRSDEGLRAHFSPLFKDFKKSSKQ